MSAKVPHKLEKVQKSVDNANNTEAAYEDSATIADTVISRIIVSTEPAELIQTAGDPLWTAHPRRRALLCLQFQ